MSQATSAFSPVTFLCFPVPGRALLSAAGDGEGGRQVNEGDAFW